MFKRISIYVVNECGAARNALCQRLRSRGYSVKCWDSGGSFIENVPDYPPAPVLLDRSLPDMDGLVALAELQAAGLTMPVAILTDDGDVPLAVRAVKAGAFDVLEKPVGDERLFGLVASASAWLEENSGLLEAERTAMAKLSALTARELEVLEGLTTGQTNKALAQTLGISKRTVEVHRAHLMTKLTVDTFADVLRIAFAAGLGRVRTSNRPGLARRRGAAADTELRYAAWH